ncbi:MAG: NAD-binding protein [Lachnospiraceae bacterium]|jgi:trk system potassium uptake protein TrkA|nr:NAD-binding protein [Lachnospiraceae bacterium]
MKTRILLIGGINKTQLLARELLKKGYQVTAVNESRDDCRKLAEIENLSVICGDGTKPFVLDQARRFRCGHRDCDVPSRQ